MGGDIISNKKTFLLLTALHTADENEQQKLLFLMNQSDFDPVEKVNAVKSIFEKLNVRHTAEEKMHTLYMDAMNHLDAIPLSDNRKDALKQLAEELMVRVT